MGRATELAGWFLGFAHAHTTMAAPLISKSDAEFWQMQSRRILDSARLAPGQTSGKWRNRTPYSLHVPGGNMGYPAFWVRDAAMMLGNNWISQNELKDWICLIASVVRNRDWQIRPGVMVPAFSIPDHINFDGKATFYPGNYETGGKQGGGNWGKYPPLDDAFYFIQAVHSHWKNSGSLALFQSSVKIAGGSMRLSELCERVYSAIPNDPASSLCIAGDVNSENAKDFGFCDSVFKSGKLLFPSVLKFVAAQQLADLFISTGAPRKAEQYRNDARKIKVSIPQTFMRPSQAAGELWLDSATEVGRQIDVWGSAFAVYSNVVDEGTGRQIGASLVRAYREKSAVRNGCVRHLLLNDPQNRKGWQKTISPLGEYQNGGYWGTATGWYLVAMQKSDPQAAASMARDYLGFLRQNMGRDGISRAWEWFNPETGKTANPLYVASVVLPFICLQTAGLIPSGAGAR